MTNNEYTINVDIVVHAESKEEAMLRLQDELAKLPVKYFIGEINE